MGWKPLLAAAALMAGLAPSPSKAVIIETISFLEPASGSGVPAVAGLQSVVTGPEFATGTYELGSPGPGPITPPGATGAVLLLDPVTSSPSDLVLFEAGLIEGFPHPSQTNVVSFYSAGAAACPVVTSCIPAGVTPMTTTETGGVQDITDLFSPISFTGLLPLIQLQILVQSPLAPVPEPATLPILAAALGVVSVMRLRSRQI